MQLPSSSTVAGNSSSNGRNPGLRSTMPVVIDECFEKN
jgi:hypothetical protein